MNIIKTISKSLLADEEFIKKYIKTAPYRYKQYKISKRNNKGTRIIAQPEKNLKYLQKFVYEKYFHKLPIHNACMAYKTGINIKNNAEKHKKTNIY